MSFSLSAEDFSVINGADKTTGAITAKWGRYVDDCETSIAGIERR
jgi:hypothetical protein